MRNQRNFNSSQSGFTLIELVMVIVILGILAATALPKFVDMGKDAREAVINGVDGSMRSANSMIYAKAAANNQTGATGSVTINGGAVSLVYGYAADVTELIKVMELSSDFDTANTGKLTIVYSKASDYSSSAHTGGCKVTYAAATATATPTYTVDKTKC